MGRPSFKKTKQALGDMWDLGCQALRVLPAQVEGPPNGSREAHYEYGKATIKRLARRWVQSKAQLRHIDCPERYLRFALALVDSWPEWEELEKVANRGFTATHVKLLTVKRVVDPDYTNTVYNGSVVSRAVDWVMRRFVQNGNKRKPVPTVEELRMHLLERCRELSC